jgi:Zn-dependent protease
VTAGDIYDASAGGVTRVLFAFGIANVLLATFNLIPLPPLDGSAVVERLLPARWWPGWLRFRRYSFGVFLLLFLGVPGFFDRILDPALRLWGNLL